MSKQILEDATSAFRAYQEAPQGSYVERAMADAIVNDIVPALIHALSRTPQPLGFANTDTVDLESQNELAPETLVEVEYEDE